MTEPDSQLAIPIDTRSSPNTVSDHSLHRQGSAPKPGEPLPAEQLARVIPGFEIDALIGSGGMGAVYRARQLDLDREVAIKVFFEGGEEGAELAERFRVEARAMARLQHPNLVAVHEFGEVPEPGDMEIPALLYIVMELIEGTDLAQLLYRGEFDHGRAIDVIIQVCAGLAYAHGNGVVHRDIKPGNILLTPDGTAKIADFGLAKILEQDLFATQLTMAQTSMGTRDYAAPEQLEAGGEVDARADVYSTGVLLYQLLTGTLPRGAYQPPSQLGGGVDPRLDPIVHSALQPDPETRTATISALAESLQRIREDSGPTRPSGRLLAAAILCVLGAVTGLLVWAKPWDIEQAPAETPPPAFSRSGPLRGMGTSLRGTPVDLSKAAPYSDFVAVASTPLGDWAALRENGELVSNQAELDGLVDIAQIEAGFGGVLAVRKDGGLVATGVLGKTSLGHLRNVAQVAAGVHVTVLFNDGSLRTWYYTAGGWTFPGEPRYYQEQDGPQVDGRVRSLEADWFAVVMLLEDGSLFCSQRGESKIFDQAGPFVDVAAGGQHFLAVHQDGTVWGWKWHLNQEPTDPAPLEELAGRRAVAVKARQSHGAVQQADGIWLPHRGSGLGVNTKTSELHEKLATLGSASDLDFFFGNQQFVLWIDGTPRPR